MDSILHSSSRAVAKSRPTARGFWPQVEDQGGAYETEADARRGDRDQHSSREARKDNERSAPRHTPHTRGHLRGVRMGQYLVLEDIVGNVDAHEHPA